MEKYKIEFLYRPGCFYTDEELTYLVEELKDVAKTCFRELPNYQCLVGTRDELSDKVITIARDAKGKMVGFCSSVLLNIENVGTIFHLGLTCVKPEARGSGLTHKLTSKGLIQYLIKFRPFGRIWVTNVACVLSSLGNFAAHFCGVYPSPFTKASPSSVYKTIAKSIDEQYRDKIFISEDSTFDEQGFLFKQSVRGTVFQKEAEDSRYHHRKIQLNNFYRSIMSFDNGDEVLQVGYISLFEGVKYHVKRFLHIDRLLQRKALARK